MPSKGNNDDGIVLILRFLVGAIAVFLLIFFIIENDVTSLFTATPRGSRGGGIPALFIIVLGIISLYYAIKKKK